MQFLIRIPDLSIHDERACHDSTKQCEIAKYRQSWVAANPIQQTLSDEGAAVAYVKSRFPDMIPMPVPMQFIDVKEPSFAVVCFENEAAVALMQLRKGGVNPVCYVELEAQTREDRKRMKKGKELLSKPLWFSGVVPPLAQILFERKTKVRTSLRLGSSEQAMQVGMNNDGRFELQIPGAISIELSPELCEEIGKLRR